MKILDYGHKLIKIRKGEEIKILTSFNERADNENIASHSKLVYLDKVTRNLDEEQLLCIHSTNTRLSMIVLLQVSRF